MNLNHSQVFWYVFGWFVVCLCKCIWHFASYYGKLKHCFDWWNLTHFSDVFETLCAYINKVITTLGRISRKSIYLPWISGWISEIIFDGYHYGWYPSQYLMCLISFIVIFDILIFANYVEYKDLDIRLVYQIHGQILGLILNK
jgi:hypothetical protein